MVIFMNKLYMGIDIGSIMTKGVIIDGYDNIITSACLYTRGKPVEVVKKVINEMQKDIDLDNYQVVGVGTTGSARRLIGLMLGASVIQNEVKAISLGTIRKYPAVRTILEIGGQDSKVILVNNEKIIDYGISSSCMAGTGAFIESLAKRLDLEVSDIGRLALKSKKRIDITGRCMVFAETDIVNKLQSGYKLDDVLAGVCHGVAMGYVNNLIKGKKVKEPIVFNGALGKNPMIIKYLEEVLGERVIVDKNAHLMGALGVAIMARESKEEKVFNFELQDYNIETKLTSCVGCANSCEIVTVYKNNKVIDHWGNKCDFNDGVDVKC